MIIGVVADTHFGARNDSAPMQQSIKRFLDTVFFPTLDRYDIKRVLHAGDYFDRRKYCNIGTARFVYDNYRTPMRKRGVQEDTILGNHDIYLRHSTDISAVQEFYRGEKDVYVHANPTELDVDGLGILMLPWITDNNRAEAERSLSVSTSSVVLGHLEISGFQQYRGLPSVGGMDAEGFNRFELVMSGHYHHKSSKGPIHYLGAPYPMIWSDYHDPRGFHLFDTDTKELTFIPNPYSLFARLVYDDTGKTHDYVKQLVAEIRDPKSPYHDAYVKVVVQAKNQPYWFDLVMDALFQVNAQDVMVIDDIIVNDDDTEQEVETTDVDTLTLMRDFINDTTISCDKDALFAFLKTKYQDAMAATQSSRLS